VLTVDKALGPSKGTIAVQADELGQRYRSRWVFKALTFGVRTGVVGLLGPNGAGKTTLLTTLATLRLPAHGCVQILGLDPRVRGDRTEIRRQLGYLPQVFGYPRRFSAHDFVTYIGWTKGLPTGSVGKAASEALVAVDLADRAHDTLGTLSGGMIRRVAIASALVNRPKLLLLDEPTAGLDPEQRVDFRALIRRLGETSTVLISTHLVEDVATMCDHVLILNDGIISYDGGIQELSEQAHPDARGDSALERGYSSALRLHALPPASGR
jgi:ABC-2 type transport system ATP-binding protein